MRKWRTPGNNEPGARRSSRQNWFRYRSEHSKLDVAEWRFDGGWAMSVLERIDSITRGADAPLHFVIALDGPDGRSFAICERIMLIRPDQRDLPEGELARFVSSNALSAAAIPLDALVGDAGPHAPASAWLRTATTAQSAEDDEPAEDDEESK
ncbi:hypothetical protein [Sphingomonas natans]|nr:hypothetical protein [Sphingomonas sp. BIUV-7]